MNNNKIDELDFIKMYNCCASKDTNEKVKTNQQYRKTDLQIIYLVKDFYLEYVKKSYK